MRWGLEFDLSSKEAATLPADGKIARLGADPPSISWPVRCVFQAALMRMLGEIV